MQTDDSQLPSPQADSTARTLAKLAAVAAAHRLLLRRVGYVASGLILAGAAFIFVLTLAQLNVGQVKAAFAATGGDQIAMAFGLSALSYLALTGYDSLALKHLGQRVPYRLTALASFTSYAVSFTLGFPIVTGGAVRYWIYGPAGLSAGRVASLTVIAGVTFWLGMGFVLGLGFLADSDQISDMNHLNVWANRAIGVGILSSLLAYYIFVARVGSRTGAVILNLKMPGPLTTLGQMTLGVIDVCAAAGSLYALLPRERAIDFVTFSALYSFGSMLGIASHAPGGLGVFEATMLKGVGGPSEPLLASLLMFRGIYYLAPFVLAMALLGGNEAVRRWRSLRAAMANPDATDES